MEADALKTVRSEWSNAVLVCRKCSKKLDGGFGPNGRTGLAKALREELGVRKGRKGALGVLDVKCLGVCPKRAVTVIIGADPGAWMLVREGAPMADVVEELGLAREEQPLSPSMPPLPEREGLGVGRPVVGRGVR